MGVDIIFDKKHGPVILELNNQPGLEIQNANRSPLKKRLERVVGLKVRDAEHGVRIGRTLFAERFADRVMAEEGVKTVKVWETVKVRAANKKKIEVKAKIDTGAWRTSIDRGLADELGLLESDNILWSKIYKSGLGVERREVVGLTFYLAGRKIETIASVAERSDLRAPMIIGRRDLKGFMLKFQ